MNDELTPRMKQEEPSSELVTDVFVYGTSSPGGSAEADILVVALFK